MKELHELGDRVADTLRDVPDTLTRAAQRRRFLAAVDRPLRRRWPLLVAMGGLAAATAVAVAVVGIPGPGDSVQFWVGETAEVAREGAMLQAPSDAPLSVRFAGGSEVQLAPAARGAIERASASRIRVALTRGRLTARVRTAPDRLWIFAAGAYSVQVLGTRLAIAWISGALTVEVHEGSVRVRGPALPDAGLQVKSNQRLRAGAGVAEPGVESVESVESVEPIAIEPDIEPPDEEQSERPGRRSSPTPLKWKQLAHRGAHADALAAARAYGLGRVLRESNAAELVLLGDAARFAREADDARRILERLALRFPRSRQGRLVPFLIGRIAIDIERDPRAAARLFKRYLDQQPRGELAEEALGRLVAVLDQAGEHEQARRAARDYLDRYPNGAYARLASTLIRDN